MTAGMTRHQRWSARFIAAVVALSVAVVFTPCCDLYAGTFGDRAVVTVPDLDGGHGHASSEHGHAPAPDPSCQVTSGGSAIPQPELMSSAQPDFAAIPFLSSFSTRLDLQAPAQRVTSPHRAAGPPPYLRFAHLLI